MIIFFSITNFAQCQTARSDSSFGKGRLQTIDGNKIYFSSITLGQDFHEYFLKGSELSQTIDATKVRKIEIQKGSYARKVAIGYGIFGLVGSIAFVKYWNEAMGQDSMDGDVSTLFILGSAAGSTMVGGLVGSLIKKYETVYRNQNTSLIK